MKVFFRQNENNQLFEIAGIKNCRFKKLIRSSENKKVHHHTEFEIHIVSDGFQLYGTGKKIYNVKSGEMLLIPPGISHQCTSSSDSLLKYAITFQSDNINCINDCVLLKTPCQIEDNLEYILQESRQKLFFSPYIANSRAFETLILILRMCNYNEASVPEADNEEDARLSIAKQYIQDNIRQNLKVSDVASYCYLSTKQLTRLFNRYDHTTPAAYITLQKGKATETMLDNSTLSLKEISELMGFSSEYHFNIFFKKYYGMPPGEFRKMIK